MDSKENYYNIKQMTESFRNVKNTHNTQIQLNWTNLPKIIYQKSFLLMMKINTKLSRHNHHYELFQINSCLSHQNQSRIRRKTQQIEPQTQYETLIQKLEADVRQHIRIEQQLRIYTETLQQKIDDFISEREQQIQLIKEYEQQIKQKNKDIVIYQSELRKAVNQNQQKHTKLVTEPIHEEYDTTYHKNKLNQTNYTHQRKPSQLNEEKSVPNKSQINSYKNSPERIPIRKISVTNYAETKAIKQPVFIRQPCPMSYSHLKTETQISYRSNSQESKYLQKLSKMISNLNYLYPLFLQQTQSFFLHLTLKLEWKVKTRQLNQLKINEFSNQ